MLLLLLLPKIATAQYVKVLGVAEKSGAVIVSGISSTNKPSITFPGATITILNSDNTNATIYSDAAGTSKSNPYQASLTDATYDFFIRPGAIFSVRVSGTSGGVTISAFTRSLQTAPGNPGTTLVQCAGTNDTSLLSAASALGGTIEIPKGVTCASNTQTISAALQVDNGGLLKPLNGQTLTLTGYQNEGTWQKYTNALASQGTISFTGNIRFGEIRPEWWGAVADGSTDCTLPLNAALAQASRVVKLLEGNYKVTANLTEPVAHAIEGAYASADPTLSIGTTITAATGVTKVLSLGNECVKLSNFRVTGNATASAIGIVFGDAEAGSYQVSGMVVNGFSGTSAVGVKLHDTQKSDFYHCSFIDSRTNLLVSGSTNNFPTTTHFFSCGFLRTSPGTAEIGTYLQTGETVSFVDCFWDSHTQEAILLLPATSGILRKISFDRPRFENNYSSDFTKFMVRAGDGTANPTLINFEMTDPQFGLNGAGAAKALRTWGSAVQGFVIRNPILIAPPASAISNEDGAFGEIAQWQGTASMVYNTVVNDPLNKIVMPASAEWKAWTPATSSDSASTGFAVGPTYTLTKFKHVGTTVFITMNISGTFNAGNPIWVQFEVPTSLTPVSDLVLLSTRVTLGGTAQSGSITTVMTGNGFLRVSKIDNSAFGAGTTFLVNATFSYQLAP